MSMDILDDYLNQKLNLVQNNNLFRTLKSNAHLIDFSSNDYFGLASNTDITETTKKKLGEIKHLANGSGGSRLISGHHLFIEELESLIAQIHETESSLVFNSGYNANMAVLSSIPQKGDLIIYDELCHASIKDGMRLSFADKFPFKHNDLESLGKKLQNERKFGSKIFVVIESVYSMNGDLAPIRAINDLCMSHNAILIIDEAHSTGIWGNKGAGLVCELGLSESIPIRIHTYGKALGCHGASVVGSKKLKDYLINFARPFIYTTAMPLHGYVSIYSSYTYLETRHKSLQETLKQKIDVFRKSLDTIKPIATESPIFCIVYPSNENAKQIALKLQEKGFDIRAILSPTVPKGSERIRICLHTSNTDEDIVRLAEGIKKGT